jgi:hypothetical protein
LRNTGDGPLVLDLVPERIPRSIFLEDKPHYRRILQASEEKEAQYWQEKIAEPVTQVLVSGQPPYPLLVIGVT